MMSSEEMSWSIFRAYRNTKRIPKRARTSERFVAVINLCSRPKPLCFRLAFSIRPLSRVYTRH